MTVLAVCGILVIAAFLTVLLRQYRPELALAVGVAAGVGISVAVILTLSEPLAYVKETLTRAGMDGGTALLLIKSLGICLLTQFTAELCRDAGESGMASRAELGGKAALLLLLLPLLRQIGELAAMMMGGGE